MKLKKLNKKLSLKKTTVASLTEKDLSFLKGGTEVATLTGRTCIYCNSDASCVLDPCKCMYEMTCPEGCER